MRLQFSIVLLLLLATASTSNNLRSRRDQAKTSFNTFGADTAKFQQAADRQGGAGNNITTAPSNLQLQDLVQNADFLQANSNNAAAPDNVDDTGAELFDNLSNLPVGNVSNSMSSIGEMIEQTQALRDQLLGASSSSDGDIASILASVDNIVGLLGQFP